MQIAYRRSSHGSAIVLIFHTASRGEHPVMNISTLHPFILPPQADVSSVSYSFATSQATLSWCRPSIFCSLIPRGSLVPSVCLGGKRRARLKQRAYADSRVWKLPVESALDLVHHFICILRGLNLFTMIPHLLLPRDSPARVSSCGSAWDPRQTR